MISTLTGLRIRGIACALPERLVRNEEFQQFAEKDREALAKATGVVSRHVAPRTADISTYSIPAARRVLESAGWDSVDALVVVSQTPKGFPDAVSPGTAFEIARRLGLKTDVAAFDVNLGCSGYVYGLWIVGSLLQASASARAVLIAGDLCTHAVDPNDRSTSMLFGDAVSATTIERSASGDDATWRFALGTEGNDTPLKIARHESACPLLRMDGPEVFGFTLKRVPMLYDELMGGAAAPEAVLFHQANIQIVDRLAKKLGVADRSPRNVDRRGNTSSASIPLLACDAELGLRSRAMDVAMLGFGIGLSWAGVRMKLGPLDILETMVV